MYVAGFYLDKPLKASTEPRRAERVGIGALVSAVWDDGPTDRHRDHTSGALAPLAGVQLDQASDVDRSHWV